ncbi:cell envelope biogenesis protein OmpA [Sphingomonas sp. Root710]|uniref:OmpA family protein n=1 Tax=Sphingomonas sp. Root710 TaxID=1736594 RepID=UPI0006F2CB64|nr:OmpA family protein [Sphingomonas sp. Root710]KRB82494.1 cell envelope biogenesis protein OmpA [Sphingomonas sp. Root710]
MRVISQTSGVCIVLAALAASGSVSAQEQVSDPSILVNAPVMAKGPEIKGVISARKDDKIKVTAPDGSSTIIAVNDATRIKTGGGLFGGRSKQGTAALLNGLPVTIKTLQAADGQSTELVASQVTFRNADLKTATMIRNATDQRFEEQTAATESLRGRLGDIDKYNLKGTTNVHFDTGKTELSAEDKAQLCSTAASAEAMDNALLLVVGYTDSTGSDDFNQQLSEKRASRVINYLQQQCGWKPYRMLTPTGMAEADPAASNDTDEGKAQNRRVAVNVMVSKSVDNM